VRPYLTSNAVLVCDLDDTLIDERDYADSGMRAVASTIHSLYGLDLEDHLVEGAHDPTRNPLAEATELLGLPNSVIDQFLSIYRSHVPDLAPREGARELLGKARHLGLPVCVITDGRSISQRRKLVAAGLSSLIDLVLISEEVGAAKPDPRAFEIVEAAYPRRSYVYVGDNPAKDFVAPRQLGWSTIGLRNSRSIHPQSAAHGMVPPDMWINSLLELTQPVG